MNDLTGPRELPRTAYFNQTLRRARSAAQERSHRYVMLEHLLFALLDDPDALYVLQGVGTNMSSLKSAVADAVNHRMASAVVPNNRSPSFSYKFDALMVLASEDAVRIGKGEIDGGVAVIAVARDPECMASGLLQKSGFDLQAGMRYLAALQPRGPRPQAHAPAPQPPRMPEPRPPAIPEVRPFHITEPANTHDASMAQMIASVRDLLDSEERGPRGPGFSAPPQAQYRAEPPAPPRMPLVARQMREAEPPPPPYSNGAAARMPAHPPAQDRGRREQPDDIGGRAARLVEDIPESMRLDVPDTVEIRLSKHDSETLFEGLKGRGQSQPNGRHVCRAISIRLAAPDGGFLIESVSAETQWVFDRPSFLDDEAFGRWAWNLLPNESGRHRLSILMASRTIDENGLAAEVVFPEVAVEVRVRRGTFRVLWGLFKPLFLLGLGAAMGFAAYYVLKTTGKLPPFLR